MEMEMGAEGRFGEAEGIHVTLGSVEEGRGKREGVL